MSDPHADPELDGLDLDALFALDTPPAHDADFVVAVAQGVARRRLVMELGGMALAMAILALLLWALGPVLAPVLKPVADTALVFMPILAVAGAVLWLTNPRHSPA